MIQCIHSSKPTPTIELACSALVVVPVGDRCTVAPFLHGQLRHADPGFCQPGCSACQSSQHAQCAGMPQSRQTIGGLCRPVRSCRHRMPLGMRPHWRMDHQRDAERQLLSVRCLRLQVPDVKGCMVANAHPELKEWCDAHPSPSLFQVSAQLLPTASTEPLLMCCDSLDGGPAAWGMCCDLTLWFCACCGTPDNGTLGAIRAVQHGSMTEQSQAHGCLRLLAARQPSQGHDCCVCVCCLSLDVSSVVVMGICCKCTIMLVFKHRSLSRHWLQASRRCAGGIVEALHHFGWVQ